MRARTGSLVLARPCNDWFAGQGVAVAVLRRSLQHGPSATRTTWDMLGPKANGEAHVRLRCLPHEDVPAQDPCSNPSSMFVALRKPGSMGSRIKHLRRNTCKIVPVRSKDQQHRHRREKMHTHSDQQPLATLSKPERQPANAWDVNLPNPRSAFCALCTGFWTHVPPSAAFWGVRMTQMGEPNGGLMTGSELCHIGAPAQGSTLTP